MSTCSSELKPAIHHKKRNPPKLPRTQVRIGAEMLDCTAVESEVLVFNQRTELARKSADEAAKAIQIRQAKKTESSH